MTIHGSGEMYEYNYNDTKEWINAEQVIIEDGVTSIGNNAFYQCEKLKSITIPASVKRIGYSVFSQTRTLENINVAEENKFYSSLDGILYNK